jgi:hypothetical protein
MVKQSPFIKQHSPGSSRSLANPFMTSQRKMPMEQNPTSTSSSVHVNLLPPEVRRTSTELLDIMAEFELSQGCSLAEHWTDHDVSLRSESPDSQFDAMQMTAVDIDQPTNSDQNVAHSWSPVSAGMKVLESLSSEVQRPRET